MKSTWRVPLLLPLAALFSLSASPARAQSVPPPNVTAPSETPFTRLVAQNFAAWDTNGDGMLSLQEIDTLVADPRVTGDEAAAVATLKLAFIRRAKVGDPPLRITTDFLARYAAAPRSKTFPAFDLRFRTLARRIHATPPALFATASAPQLANIRQGLIGDCYYLAFVGGLVSRDPGQVRHMIVPNADGSYDVTFPAGQKAHVPPVTDAEVALSSNPMGSGRWLPVLEAAFGAVRETLPGGPVPRNTTTASAHPGTAAPRLATDVIRTGGSMRQVIRLLTGHPTGHVSLRPAGVQALPAPDAVAQTLPAVRAGVIAALHDKRLIGTGTTRADRPPDITPDHAYAVLGYDPTTDMITLWNPHGQNFAPQGTPGLKNGYATRNGVLSLPLIEFAQIFVGVNWELGTA